MILRHALRCALAMYLAFVHANTHADFMFAAFGDTPYIESEERDFLSMIGHINAAAPAFSVHVGDFKSSWAPCTDALFRLRREQFAMFQAPLIYVPGDNEWQDCHRGGGPTSDPLERLAKLHTLFFADARSLGKQALPLTRQNAQYPEHVRWEHEGVLFVTLNAPGPRNNHLMPQEAVPRKKAKIGRAHV